MPWLPLFDVDWARTVQMNTSGEGRRLVEEQIVVSCEQ